jgi:hypothetical protein
MGRKAKFSEASKVKKGPGRKAKKQGEPELPSHISGKLSEMGYMHSFVYFEVCFYI